VPGRRGLRGTHRVAPGAAAGAEKTACTAPPAPRRDAGGAARIECVAGAAAAERHLGGLWCLPEFDSTAAAEQFASSQLGRTAPASAALPDIEHSFTHFDLVITPLMVNCGGVRRVNEATELWYDLDQPARVGLPAPIKTLLGSLAENMES